MDGKNSAEFPHFATFFLYLQLLRCPEYGHLPTNSHILMAHRVRVHTVQVCCPSLGGLGGRFAHRQVMRRLQEEHRERAWVQNTACGLHLERGVNLMRVEVSLRCLGASILLCHYLRSSTTLNDFLLPAQRCTAMPIHSIDTCCSLCVGMIWKTVLDLCLFQQMLPQPRTKAHLSAAPRFFSFLLQRGALDGCAWV